MPILLLSPRRFAMRKLTFLKATTSIGLMRSIHLYSREFSQELQNGGRKVKFAEAGGKERGGKRRNECYLSRPLCVLDAAALDTVKVAQP